MGKKQQQENTYETIPEVKKERVGGSSKDGVRYVKDPLASTQPPAIGDESRYAFHITYHHDEPEANNSHYSTQGGFIPTPPPLANPQNPLLRSQTLPHGVPSNQLSTLNAQALTHAPQRTLTRARSPTDKSRRVGFVGNDDGLVITAGSTYTTERLRHFTEEGNLAIQYDPASYTSDYEPKKKKGKERKEKKGCSCPPWWAWLIIILVVCLLGAVLYFVFGQLLKPSSDATSTSTLNPIVNVTSSQNAIGDVTASPSSSSSTHTTKQVQSSSTSQQQTTTTTSTTQATTTTTTTTTPTPTTTRTTTTTATPTTTVDPSIIAELFNSFSHTPDTRSLRSQSSTRVSTQSTTLQGCLRDCLSSQPICFGIDYNEQWLTCHLLILYDYGLEPIGGDLRTQNYRRVFKVKSFCQEALYFHSERTFSSSVRYRSQPSEVDTLSKCRQACFGDFGNGVQDAGYRCSAAVFNRKTRRCLISDVPYDPSTLTDSQDSIHFINDGIECIEESKAACSIKFSAVKNKQPYDTDSRLRQEGVVSVPECGSRCIQYGSMENVTCQGFIFSYADKTCTLFTGPRNTALGTVSNTDFYGINNPKCSECGYVQTKDHAVSSSRYQDAYSRTSCEDRCTNWDREGETCYGYNWRGTSNRCSVITTPKYTLEPGSGTDNYQKDPACRECSPSEFLATSHTSPIGGTRKNSPTSMSRCARSCQLAVGPDTNRRCYGFTYDRDTNDCYHFYLFNYDLNSIGGSPQSDHFRRRFGCSNSSTPCNKYNKTADTKAKSPGVLQPWDIRSVSACKDRCLGYGLTSNRTCYAVDFNRRISACTVYLDSNYTLGTPGDMPGTDHYKKLNC